MKNDIENIVLKYLENFPEESENLVKLSTLIENNNNNYSNIFSRKNFEGHITASGFIYCIAEKKLLLLEHKSLKKFLQPGGHVELVDNKMIDDAMTAALVGKDSFFNGERI